VPKFGRKVPHLRCDSHTSFKVKRSKVRVTRPINADTHRAPSYEWLGLRTSNLVHGWRTTTRISHRRHDLQGQRSRTHVISLSRVGLMQCLSLEAGGGIPCRPNPAATLCLCKIWWWGWWWWSQLDDLCKYVNVNVRTLQYLLWCQYWLINRRWFKIIYIFNCQ